MSTVLTSYSCKSVMQDTAIKITIDNLSHIRPEKAILSFKALLIELFKCLEIIFNTLIILGVLWSSGAIDWRGVGHCMFSERK
jgi:hypothetical protein